MKKSNIWQNIFLILLLVFVIFLAREAIPTFLNNHTYYSEMISNSKNRWMTIVALLCAAIPTGYLGVQYLTKGKISRRAILGTLTLGVLLFSRYHTATKAGGLDIQYLGLTFNTLLLFGLGVGFVVAMYTLGSWITNFIPEREKKTTTSHLLTRGLGLIAHLFVIYILALANILLWPLVLLWTIFLGFLVYRQRKELHLVGQHILALYTGQSQTIAIVTTVLILLSIMYFLFGFNLSFVPYSTARDANHLYMYMPKIRSQHGGVFRSDGPWSQPYMWLMYISYWFSLTEPLRDIFWLAPDTFAVNLNMRSGIFALVLGVGLTEQISRFLSITEKFRPWVSVIGRTIILSWLTSGMGAFLVFVDNKTDLGIMSLVILALLSGIYVLTHTKETMTEDQTTTEKTNPKTHMIYVIVSGLFFAFAALAKPTSFQDIALMGLFMVGLWGGLLRAIGGGLSVLGVLGLLKLYGAQLYLSSAESYILLIVGISIIILSSIFSYATKNPLTLSHKKQRLKDLIFHGRTLSLWIGTILAVLLIVRGPYLVVRSIMTDSFNPSTIIKQILLGQNSSQDENNNNNNNILLAQDITEPLVITEGADIGFNQKTQSLSASQCNLYNVGYSETQQLYEDLEAPVGNGLLEDMGRYVGYGQRGFGEDGMWVDRAGRLVGEESISQYVDRDIGYFLLRGIFSLRDIIGGKELSSTETCFSVDSLGYALCDNTKQQGDIQRTQETVSLLPNTPIERKDLSDKELNTSIETYFSDHVAIKTENMVYVPYRWLNPLNIVFNRSLQNLSSYYTDIGFIRLFVYLCIFAGLIYSITKRSYRDILIHIIAIIARSIRWTIAMGIVWYGVGLIVRSMFSVISTLSLIHKHNREESQKVLFGCIITVLSSIVFFQLLLNFLRISSQGAGGSFAQYKGSAGTDMLAAYDTDNWEKLSAVGAIDPNVNPLQYSQYIRQMNSTLEQGQRGQFTPAQRSVLKDIFSKSSFNQQDVFETQFPFYQGFIDHTEKRDDADGVYVAGTYLSYFLDKHTNHRYDGLVGWMGKMVSDNDACATDLRLADNNLRYIVIDPNIASVVQGEGNKSLFYRFFGEVSGQEKEKRTLTHKGVLTMMSEMKRLGYVDLRYTNNIGIKYAFTLTNEEIQQIRENLPADMQASLLPYSHDEDLLRGVLMTPSYAFRDNGLRTAIREFIAQTFFSRLQSGLAIGDIADIYGRQIELEKLRAIISQGSQQQRTSGQRLENLSTLSPSEMFILEQYYVLITLGQGQGTEQQQEFSRILQSLVQRGITSQSQILILERTQ